MEKKIIYTKNIVPDELYSWIYRMLPPDVQSFVISTDKSLIDCMTEIRLRADSISCITSMGRNIVIKRIGTEYPVRVSEKDIDDFVYKVCRGSVYSYEQSIAGGFITVDGIRIGISGDVTTKNGAITGFSKIKSLNIRLPRHIDGCADGLLSIIKDSKLSKPFGILVASEPGVGKTTVLRELAVKLTSIKPHIGITDKLYRVSIIDERCEIYIPSLFKNCCADIYRNIPKHKGIELASRTMNPEIIIFDEIGSEQDAASVMSSHLGGTTFISSVHASTPDTVKSKRIIKMLADENIFTHIYFLERNGQGINGTIHKVKQC